MTKFKYAVRVSLGVILAPVIFIMCPLFAFIDWVSEPEEEGSVKYLLSEYKRLFKRYPTA